MMLKKNNYGYVALVAVLIILAVSIITGVAVSLNAINEMQLGLSSAQSEQAFIIADSCAEEALLRMKRNEIPPASLSFTSGSCIIEVDDTGGDSRIIKVTGIVNDYYSLVEIDLTIGSSFSVNSWQEVGEFTP